jgi:NAD-dependent deacetylase
VDDLHERAGAKRLLHVHGELLSALCRACGEHEPFTGAMTEGTLCSACGARDALRPDIVFFGEMPYEMERIEQALMACDMFVSIGTSGAVYPAAGFVQIANAANAWTLELNLELSAGSYHFDDAKHGPASLLVPDWVESVLKLA